jgi:GTP-binding protein
MRLIDFSKITFLKSAPNLLLCPPDSGIEVAFMGRSNAGKSSAINAICTQTKLARTSKTPGRTQLINIFTVTEEKRLIDLPGYGYAKVPVRVHEQIEKLLNEYLSDRQCLKGVMLMMDIRHPLMPGDKQLIDYAKEACLPLHILLTKSDKFKRGKSQDTLLQVRKALSTYSHISVQTFSALQNIGIEEAQAKLESWFTTVEE